MLFINPGTGCFKNTRYLHPVHDINPPVQPERERLRHLIIGSQAGVQGAIDQLHLLRYADRFEWSRLFTIPESGIVITPEQGEWFSYLLRYRPLD